MDQNGRAPASAATRLIAGGSEIDVILNVQRSAIKARGERLDAMLDKRILYFHPFKRAAGRLQVTAKFTFPRNVLDHSKMKRFSRRTNDVTRDANNRCRRTCANRRAHRTRQCSSG